MGKLTIFNGYVSQHQGRPTSRTSLTGKRLPEINGDVSAEFFLVANNGGIIRYNTYGNNAIGTMIGTMGINYWNIIGISLLEHCWFPIGISLFGTMGIIGIAIK